MVMTVEGSVEFSQTNAREGRRLGFKKKKRHHKAFPFPRSQAPTPRHPSSLGLSTSAGARL
jgi:hypothetical protein